MSGFEDNDEVQTRSPATPGAPCSPTSPLEQKKKDPAIMSQTNSLDTFTPELIEVSTKMSYLRAKWSHRASASLQDNKKTQLVQILQ